MNEYQRQHLQPRTSSTSTSSSAAIFSSLSDEIISNSTSPASPPAETIANAHFTSSPLAEIVSNTSSYRSPLAEIVSNTSSHRSPLDKIVSHSVIFSSLTNGIVAEHRLRRFLPDETTYKSLWARFRHVFCFVDDIVACTTRDMDNPRDDTTKEQYRSRGVFTIAGVRADPETSGMEAAFAASHAALMTKEREVEDLQDTVQEHEAIISVRDAATDKLVRSFDLRLLDLVNKNRDDPRYRRYFPKEPLFCPAAPPLPDRTTTRTFADLNRKQ